MCGQNVSLLPRVTPSAWTVSGTTRGVVQHAVLVRFIEQRESIAGVATNRTRLPNKRAKPDAIAHQNILREISSKLDKISFSRALLKTNANTVHRRLNE